MKQKKSPEKVMSTVTVENADIAQFVEADNSRNQSPLQSAHIYEPKVVMRDTQKMIQTIQAQTSQLSNDTFNQQSLAEKPDMVPRHFPKQKQQPVKVTVFNYEPESEKTRYNVDISPKRRVVAKKNYKTSNNSSNVIPEIMNQSISVNKNFPPETQGNETDRSPNDKKLLFGVKRNSSPTSLDLLKTNVKIYSTFQHAKTSMKSNEQAENHTVGVQESSDLDQVTLKHYNDYLHQHQPSIQIPKIMVTSEDEIVEKPKNFSNRKVSKVSSQVYNPMNPSVIKHDLTIEEIAQNHLLKVKKNFDKYMKEKVTVETIPNTEQQMAQRIIPNTYQTMKRQLKSISPTQLKIQAGGQAVRTLVTFNNSRNTDDQIKFRNYSEIPNYVESKKAIQVPKDLIMMKLAQQQSDVHSKFFTQKRSESFVGTQLKAGHPRLSLPLNQPFLALPLTSRDEIPVLNQPSIDIQQESKQAKILDSVQLSTVFDTSNSGNQSFHITDLLEKSKPRGQNKTRAAIAFWKRAIKTEAEMGVQKEVIIKNYRLRIVDAHKDLSEQDRKLMKLNRGTSIYVANSLIKPEIYRYSTKVSNAMVEVFHEMRDQRYDDLDSLTFQDQLEEESGLEQQAIQHMDEENYSQKSVTNVDRPRQTTPSQLSQQQSLKSQGVFYEPDEFQAIQLFQDYISCWLEQQKQITQDDFQPEQRPYILANGQPAPLGVLEIKNAMNKLNTTPALVKPKEISVDKLTQYTQIQSKPYMYFMKTIITPEIKFMQQQFLQKTVKYIDHSQLRKNHQQHMVQTVDFDSALLAIDIVRKQYTHLDPHLMQDQNVLQELFIQQHLIQELIDRMQNCPINAKTSYFFQDNFGNQVMKEIEVQIVGIDQSTKLFIVQNEKLNIQTLRSRVHLCLDTDEPGFIQELRQTIIKYKAEAQQHLRVPRLIQNELLPRYSDHRMPERTRENIKKFLKQDLKSHPAKLVELVIVQVEALYVYSLMKSTLSSQRDDPFIKNMLVNFKVAQDSPALDIDKQPIVEKKDLNPGIYSFKINGVRKELQANSLRLSSQKYIQLPKLLYSITYEAIKDAKIFIAPIPETLLYGYGSAKFRQMRLAEVRQKINTYPLNHEEWIEAESVIQQVFHKSIKTDWAEVIGKKVWDFIKEDFDFDPQTRFSEDQIDENLLRLFYQMRQYQTTILYEVFEKGLKNYLKFLISFANRNQDIRKSQIINTIRNSDVIRLNQDDPNEVNKVGDFVNDLDLIPLERGPLINVKSEIQITGKSRNKKFKVITSPELEKIHADMFSVVKSMHDATKDLKRVDAVIFPLLTLKSSTIPQPDVKNNPKMTMQLKLIDKLLDQCINGCKLKVKDLTEYMTIFNKQPESLILELKKQSFALANGGSDEEEEDHEAEEVKPAQIIRDKNGSQMSVPEGQDSDEEVEDDDDQGAGFQVNNMAFKSVEINKDLLYDELNGIRAHRYQILENVANTYDLGLLKVDCTPYKTLIVEHCQALEETISKHVRSEFMEQMKNVVSEIGQVKGRLDDNAETIDDVISLLAYIDSLKRQDNKIEEIADYIGIMADQMNFIYKLKIIFDQDTMMKFLNIRNWPRTFDSWIQNRKRQLNEQKDKLIREMQNECENIYDRVLEFKQQISKVFTYGLVRITKEARKTRVYKLQKLLKSVEDHQQALLDKDQKFVPEEIPENFSFEFLAQEAGWHKQRFDVDIVQEVYTMIDKTKSNFEAIDKMTLMINKRQVLLGVERTDFSDLKKIQDELKPLHEMWTVAVKFKKTMPEWLEGTFDSIDSYYMETVVEEWVNELKKLQKVECISKNTKSAELVQFIFECLSYFKKYFPTIKILRIKGLGLRHWRQINTTLVTVVEPSNTSLFKLIQLGFHLDEKFKVCKAISDVAQKEYAVQTATEILDKEMRAVEFYFDFSHDRSIKVIKFMEELIAQFEEFNLRVSVLKTNPHMKNFYEKLQEIEKISKVVTDIISEFNIFQRSWLFLNGIFSKSSLSEQLPLETKLFNNVCQFYKSTIRSLIYTPQVYKIVNKEGFLIMIRKANTDSDVVKEGLHKFLEKKRSAFPRLYFLSNEELFDLYGKQQQIIEEMVQGQKKTFVQRLFEGIEDLVIDPDTCEITALTSSYGERVDFKTVINTTGMPDVWMQAVERGMLKVMKKMIFETYEDMDRDIPPIPEDFRELQKYKETQTFRVRKVVQQTLEDWIKKWPAQTCYLSMQIWFTQKVSSIFVSSNQRLIKINDDKQAKKLILQSQNKEMSSDDSSDEYKSVDLNNEDAPQEVYQQIQQQREEQKRQEILNSQNDDEQNDEVQSQHSKQSTTVKAIVIAKSKFTVLEKIMRFQDRFCLNNVQHPTTVYQDVKNTVIQKTSAMSSMLRHKVQSYTRENCVSLITLCVFQRDLLQKLLQQRIYKPTEFEWEVQMKFELENLSQVTKNLSHQQIDRQRQEWCGRLGFDELNLKFDFLNYQRNYGYEYHGNCTRLVISPLTERIQRSMCLALQNNFGTAPEGPFGTGKTETTKDLARTLGMLCMVQSGSGEFDYEVLTKLFKGAACCGSWLIFDEFNRLEPEQMNFLASIITQIQTAIRQQVKFVTLEESKINIQFEAAYFVTMNPGFGRNELPSSMRDLFRTVQMVVPNDIFICEVLLHSYGFTNAPELSKKICHIQKLANVVMRRNLSEHQDFGLRAIRAIIQIACGLKLQVQNILISEIPDIISDEQMKVIPWQGQKLIHEVIVELGGEQKKTNSKAMAAIETVISNKISPLASKDPSLQQSIKQLQENKSSPTYTRKQSQMMADDKSKQFNLKQYLSKMIPSFNNYSDKTLFYPAETDDKKHEKLQGQLFELVFEGDKPRNVRQLETLYRQIGVDESQAANMTEADLEDYILIKSIREYNNCKYAQHEHASIDSIIKDVFIDKLGNWQISLDGTNTQNYAQGYSNLSNLVVQAFDTEHLDYNKTMEQRCYQLYEITQVKSGCIILGDSQSGKTTMINLLQTALNAASFNELQLRVVQERKQKLKNSVFESPQVEQLLPENVISDWKRLKKTEGSFNQSSKMKTINSKNSDQEVNGFQMGGYKKKQAKLSDRQKLVIWQDLYKKTVLSDEKIDEIRQELVLKGVEMQRINPKSIQRQELVGVINSDLVWSEGQFTEYFRRMCQDHSQLRKWIHIDGPMDTSWVEDFNSILDENRKIHLPTGETLKMSDNMCVLFETCSVKNITPATVSRCGLIFADLKELSNPKQIFNQYLNRLPPNLVDSVKDLEMQVNQLYPTCLRVFKSEQVKGNLLLNSIDEHWLVQNFIKILDSFIAQYWLDFINGNKQDFEEPQQQSALRKCTMAYGHQRRIQRVGLQEDTKTLDPDNLFQEFIQMRLLSSGKDATTNIFQRIAVNDFIQNENRQENSLKFLPIWMEVFVITALAGTFGLILRTQARQQLSELLKQKIADTKSDFSTYQKLKKKNQMQRDNQAANKQIKITQLPGVNSSDQFQSADNISVASFLTKQGFT